MNYRFLLPLTACLLLAAPLARAQTSGYALDFDGVNDSVSVPLTAPPASDYTLSAWVYLRAGGTWGGTRMAVLSSTTCGGSIELLIHANTEDPADPQFLELGRCNDFNGVPSTIPAPLNAWTHVAVTVSAEKTIRYFINGVPAGTWDGTGLDFSLGTEVSLGDNNARRFNGRLDEVQIWNRVLSQGEIQGFMNRRLAGNEAGLYACYHFDEGAGTTAGDSAPAGGTASGTLVNGPVWVPSGVAPFSLAATLTHAGNQLDLGAGWRTSTNPKPLDVDGDNILGTDGYQLVNRPLVLPAYVSAAVIPAGTYPGNPDYALLDDPTDVPNTFTPGTLTSYPGTGVSVDLFKFTLNASAVGRVIRVGLLVDNLDGANWNATSFSLVQTSGAGATNGPVATTAAALNNRVPDWVFFDLTGGVAGDVFVIRGVAGIYGAATLGGVAFDSTTSLVTSPADNGPGSLRQTVAGAPSGGWVLFAPHLSGATILLTNGQLLLDKSLAIDASSLPGGITINGNRASRVLEAANGTTVLLKSLSISNGYAGGGGSGGGILAHGTLTLDGVSVLGNYAAYGGGIHQDNGLLVVSNSLVANNTAYDCGGVYNWAGSSVVVNSTITGNSATNWPGSGGGGAISGGGFKSYVGSSVILNTTIAGNAASDFGGGINNFGGTLTLSNTIVAGNLAPAATNLAGAFSGGNNVIDQAPLLASLGNYGGRTLSMPPLLGSPAIDAGGPTPLATDQRGFPRLVGPAPDIGAVEAAIPNPVLTTADSGYGSLRYAVAYSAAGSTITFAINLSGATILLTNGQILLNMSLAIDASALPGGITLDGNHASRVLEAANGTTVLLKSLSISNGYAGAGGGILTHGTLTLDGVSVVGNYATFGGGIYQDNGLLVVSNSLVANNTSYDCGGVYNWAGSSALVNSTITGNSATNGADPGGFGVKSGGGLKCYVGSSVILHTTIAGNSASDFGGGINNFGGTLALSNSIVAGNLAPASTNVAGTISGGYNLIDQEPLLAPLGNHGGRTQSRPPLPGSPAIDTGGPTTLTTDQRGPGFPRVLGSAPDIGSVETAYPEIAVQQPVGTNLVDGAANIGFGTVSLGNGSAALVFTITNSGHGDLILTNLTVDGPNPGDFAVSALLSFSLPFANDFNGNNGGFTVTTPQSYEGPWAYDAANGSWRENGQAAEIGHPCSSYLSSPTVTLPGAGAVELTFAHRWSFEDGGGAWDGGQVQISVNGGAYVTVPSAAFTQNGYNGNIVANSRSILHGQAAFISASAGHATATFITSKAILGTFNAGDTLAVRFVAAGDTNTRGAQPCWEITSYALTSSFTHGWAGATFAPGASATFTVQFVPTSLGIKTATLHLLNNDSDENPFDIAFTGTGVANPLAVSLTGPTRLGDGSFRFGFTSVNGASFTVFASTNVAAPYNTWSNLGPAVQVPPGSGQFQFTDPQAATNAQRFYRVRTP